MYGINTHDAKDVLARTLWGEARNQSDGGMKAVACVVLNRVKDPGWWGHDIPSVCLKPSQFSCWNKDDPNLPKLEAVTAADPVFTKCLQIAHLAVGGALIDITGGSTHYYERHLKPPKWAIGLSPNVTRGDHLFFKIGR